MSHILIIGGTRGIGKAIADRLAETNKVTVIGRTADKYAVDVTNALRFEDVLSTVVASEGHVDHLVYIPKATWETLLETLRWAWLECVSAVVINSIASSHVAPDQGAEYHVLKAANAALVRVFACGHPEENFRVNGVCPGRIREDGSGDCTPVEVADVIGFLLSPASAAINGQHIVLDRGRSLRLP